MLLYVYLGLVLFLLVFVIKNMVVVPLVLRLLLIK